MNIKYTSELPTADSIYGLYEHLGWNAFLQLDQDRLLAAMRLSWYAIYAYHGSRLIATGRIISDGITNAYLCGLGVHSDYRGKGIGKEVMRLLMEHCNTAKVHLQFFCEEELVPYYENMDCIAFAVGMRKK